MTALETVLTAPEMAVLVAAHEYVTWPAYIGGQGYVILAQSLTVPNPPRYEFDPARRVWHLVPLPNPIPCPRCQGTGTAIEPHPCTALPALRRCAHCHGLGQIPGGPP